MGLISRKQQKPETGFLNQVSVKDKSYCGNPVSSHFGEGREQGMGNREQIFFLPCPGEWLVANKSQKPGRNRVS